MKPAYLYPTVIIALLHAPAALAQQGLFPTAILDQGEIDATLGLLHAHATNSLQLASGAHADQTLDQTIAKAEVRYGLGAHWHVGLALRNDPTYEARTSYDNGPSLLSSNNEGQQNPVIWAKYGFIDDRNSPYSLSGELKIAPATTGKYTAYEEGRLIGGRRFGNGLQGYLAYTAHVPHDPKYSHSHTISGSAFKTVTDTITVVPELYYKSIAANDIAAGTHQYGAELSVQVKIEPTTYVRPGIGVFRVASTERTDGLARWGAIRGSFLSVTLYRLF